MLGRPARDHRLHPGARGHQDPPRHRRAPRSAGCWPTTPSRRPSAPSRCAGTPSCPACGPNAGEIVIAEYDELCMPHGRRRRPEPEAPPASSGAWPVAGVTGHRPSRNLWTMTRQARSDERRRHRLGHRGPRRLRRRRPRRLGLRRAARRPGRLPLHPGHPRRHVPGAAVDDAPVRRVRHGRGDQRAVQVPAGRRPDRAVVRLRPADPDGLRLGPPARRGRGRQGRRGHRLAGRHAPAAGRPAARQGDHVDDDQRHRGDPAPPLPAGGRGAGRRPAPRSAAPSRTTS